LRATCTAHRSSRSGPSGTSMSTVPILCRSRSHSWAGNENVRQP
jgi:hypothetical protein